MRGVGRVLAWRDRVQDLTGTSSAPAVVRQMRRAMGPPGPTGAPVAGVTATPGSIGGVPGELLEPGAAAGTDRGLFFHGGAYIAGSAAGARTLFGPLARQIGISAWSVDYALAPEHPYPAALDDAMAAYRACAPAVLAGESSGGNLAIATLLRAAAEGLPLPRAAVLFWPLTDHTLSSPSMAANEGRDLLTRQLLEYSAASYIGAGDRADPLLSPVFAEVAGLPPLFVQVGSLDLLVDDARRFVAHVRDAGGAAQLDEWPGRQHGFAVSGDADPVSAEAIARAADWAVAQLR